MFNINADGLRKRIRHILLVGAVGAGLLALNACTADVPPFVGVDITGANYAKDFDLTDQT